MTNKLIQIDQLKTSEGFQNLDLSGGYVCDVETGICGPIKESKTENENVEEKEHANNNLV